MAEKPVEQKFKTNVGYIGQIILKVVIDHKDGHPELPDARLVAVGNKVLEDMEPVDIIFNFILFSQQYWPQIKARQETFFTERADEVFGKIPYVNLKAFSIIFERKLIDAENKRKLWDYFNVIVRQAIAYLHNLQKANPSKPVVISTKGQPKEFNAEQIRSLIVEYEVTKF